MKNIKFNAPVRLTAAAVLLTLMPTSMLHAVDICWKNTATRGAGVIPSVCPSNLSDKNAGLCYTPCQAGYTGGAATCWQNCPSGYTDMGVGCTKPAAYGRGAGYPWTAWDGLKNPDYYMEQRCTSGTGMACEMCGAIAYPVCKAGFHAVGCNICSPDCPSGMTDAGATCTKATYARGAGVAPTSCAAGTVNQAGLCYTPCASGSVGVGPVCWASCTGTYPVDCGAACGVSTAACAKGIGMMVASYGEYVVNVAGLVFTGGTANAALLAAKTAGKVAMDEATKAAAEATAQKVLSDTANKLGTNLTTKVISDGGQALVNGQQDGTFDYSKLDPTGIADIVNAFNKPICGTN